MSRIEGMVVVFVATFSLGALSAHLLPPERIEPTWATVARDSTVTGYVSRIRYDSNGDIESFVLECDDGASEQFDWSTSYPTSWARIIEDSLDPPQDDIDVTYADDGSTITNVEVTESTRDR